MRALKVLAAGLAFSVLAPAGIANAATSSGDDILNKGFVAKAEKALAQHKRLTQKQRAAIAVHWAYKHLGAPYSYGSTGPHSYDCSAFVGAAWRAAGVHLPRTTYAIYGAGFRHVSSHHMQPGDIIELFGMSHVGIYVGHGYIIHESSSRQQAVRVTLTYLGGIDGVVRPG